jgi:hypothetical protein
MAGFARGTNADHLVRANLWSTQLKEVLLDELFAMKYVDMITDFPDGDTLNIPSIGQAEILDYAENQPVRYTAMDTGNFTFTITDYKASATYITNKMKQDSYVMDRIVASFVPKQHRALMKAIEIKILNAGPSGQTASNSNTINNAKHRFVATGTNQIMTVQDFAKASYALDKANVPNVNRVAIVDPSVAYTLSTLTNLVNVSFNPEWRGIIETGLSTGIRFIRNIYGFDVYESKNLNAGMSETIDSVAVTNGVANVFFSAAPEIMPIVGLMRQPPKVDSEYNKDRQRDEYITTARYGFKLFRPENMVTILSDTSRVYS